MPREVFVAGQVLTAAELNVVSDQSVMVFAGTAARGSAIPSPSEGMVTYREDDNVVEVFDGSSYVGLSGDVKGVFYAQMTVAQTFSANSSTFTDLTGLSITVTPKSTASKFLVESVVYMVNASAGGRTVNKIQVLAGATVLELAEQGFTSSDANSLNPPNYYVSALHEPASVSPITFKTQAAQATTGSVISVFINRREDTTAVRALSSLKVTEFE